MNTLYIFQILISLLLITLIVLQAKGSGLGRNFSSTNYHSKRGAEKTIFGLTIFTAIIFIITAILSTF